MTTELPDVNVLVALLQPSHVGHEMAMQWFESVESYATTPVTELGFVRLALNPESTFVDCPAIAR